MVGRYSWFAHAGGYRLASLPPACVWPTFLTPRPPRRSFLTDGIRRHSSRSCESCRPVKLLTSSNLTAPSGKQHGGKDHESQRPTRTPTRPRRGATSSREDGSQVWGATTLQKHTKNQAGQQYVLQNKEERPRCSLFRLKAIRPVARHETTRMGRGCWL